MSITDNNPLTNPDNNEPVNNEIRTEVPESVEVPESIEVKHIVMDGRMSFVMKDGGIISPYNTTNLSRVVFTGDNLLKTYPDPENDAVDALAVFNAGSTHNEDVVQGRGDLTGLTNTLSYTNPEGKSRKTAITLPKPPMKGNNLNVDDAILAITSSLGLAGRIQAPLVNTGCRVEMRCPSGDELILLDEYLLRHKGEMGRFTFGASMTYNSVYLNRDIVDLAKRCIIRTNLGDIRTGAKLSPYIQHDDYPTLVLALLALVIPDGYDVNVPCLSEDSACNHIMTGEVYPARMWTVDDSLLTDKQLEIITRPISEIVSYDEQVEYLTEFNKQAKVGSSYSFTRGGLTYTFNYQRPTTEMFIESGVSWASGINRIITQATNGTDDMDISKRLITRQLNLNNLSKFACWFKSVVLTDAGDDVLVTVDTMDGIIKLLKDIIVYEEVQSVIDSVGKYVYGGNPVVIGVANENCPMCKKEISPDNTVVVPQDIDYLFFTRVCDQAVFNAIIGNSAILG